MSRQIALFYIIIIFYTYINQLLSDYSTKHTDRFNTCNMSIFLFAVRSLQLSNGLRLTHRLVSTIAMLYKYARPFSNLDLWYIIWQYIVIVYTCFKFPCRWS